MIWLLIAAVLFVAWLVLVFPSTVATWVTVLAY
jgi:hypothetical protein